MPFHFPVIPNDAVALIILICSGVWSMIGRNHIDGAIQQSRLMLVDHPLRRGGFIYTLNCSSLRLHR